MFESQNISGLSFLWHLTFGFPGKTQLPKSKKIDDVIRLWCTCIQVAVLYWENHVPGNTIHAGLYAGWQFWLFDDIYICHQIVRIVNRHKAQHELFQMVFPVQHSYLDTCTSKADYIINFLGLWELCFARKTKHTSWPSFSLVSKMSEERQARSHLRLKRIILEKHREMNF